MDLESAQNNVVAKLPLLKQGDYEMWKLRIVQYFQVQDYALWDVIENGNFFKLVPRITANANGTSTLTIPGPVTTEEKAQEKNDIKARSMLLMALPNEHLLTFSQYKDAKTLFEAIQARFGSNDATKNTQKTLLKQMYENFNAPSIDLPSEWNTYVVVWRNKADLDTMSIDDLYNNFKIIEQEVKRTITTSSSSGSQNMAFLSSPKNTNEVDTANIQVSTVSTPVSTVSTHDNTANLSDATVYAFQANQPNRSQLVHEDLEQIHEDDLEEMDLKWQLALLSMRARRNQESRPRNQDNSRKTVNVEDTSSKAMVEIDGACFDWSYMTDDEAPTNMALMAFSDSENEVMFCDQIVVLKRDASFKDSEINALNLQIEKLKKEKKSNHIKIDNYKNASKILDKLTRSQISDNSRTCLGFTSYNVVVPPPTGLFAPLTIDLFNFGLEEFQHPEFIGYGPKDSKSVCVDTSNEIKKALDAPIIKDWVFDSDEDESEEMVLKYDNVQHKPEQANQPRKVSQNPRNNITNWNEMRTQKLGVGFQFTKKACFVCRSFSHLIKDCDFLDKKMVQKPVLKHMEKRTSQREVRPVWNNTMRINHQNLSNSKRNFAPAVVLTKSGIVPISTARQSSSRAATPVSVARPINTIAPKPLVNVAKPRQNDL
nr:hypothetical protein [Tanacetum cinerariifolium]